MKQRLIVTPGQFSIINEVGYVIKRKSDSNFINLKFMSILH